MGHTLAGEDAMTGYTAHIDTFARDHLPPSQDWPVMDYSVLPELAAYPPRFNAAAELLDATVAAGHGHRPVYHFEGRVITYRQLQEQVNRIARVLVEDLGMVTGNRVLIRGFNHPMVAACWLAVVKAGGIAVATMPQLRARELGYIVGKARVGLALCDARLAEEMEATRQRADGL